MSKLIVVAHPDDEVLALGGTTSVLNNAREVHTCILSAQAEMRQHRPSDDDLKYDILNAHDIAGMTPSFSGDFPNIAMNTVAHVELVQFIEKAIQDSGATQVYTHHPRDLNDDHRQVSEACQAAVRLSQRRTSVAPLTGFYYVEVPSATDWAFNVDGASFRPTGFFAIGEAGLRKNWKRYAPIVM